VSRLAVRGGDTAVGSRWARLRALMADAKVPLLVYALMSMFSAALVAVGGWRQAELPGDDSRFVGWFPVEILDRYLGVVSNWDGRWYREIAEVGYPVPLPRAEDGQVLQNAWAFWPLYPAIVRAVMEITKLSFEPTAWVVSIICTATAVVVLYRWIEPRMGAFGAGAVVACLLAFPSAPILQMGYAESLALLLLVLALSSLARMRYGLVCLFAILLSLTRPVALPLAAVVVIHGALRWLADRRRQQDFSSRERLSVALTAVACAGSMGLWPVLADFVVGEQGIYVKTLSAWPVNQDSVGVLGGWVPELFRLTPLGFVCVCLLAWIVYLAIRRESQYWPTEVRAWALAYAPFIFIGTRPSSSIYRYLLFTILLALPFPEVVARRPGSRWEWVRVTTFLVLVLGVSLSLQFFWVMGYLTIAASSTEQPYP